MQWLDIWVVCEGFSFLERERERELILSRFLARSDRRFSMEQKVKLLYAARTTRGQQFGGVLTTPRGRDIFLLDLFFGYEPCLWLGIF